MMDLFLDFLSLLIFLHDVPSCSMFNFNTRTEYFQLFNKHQNIAECANKVFGKNEFIGCRLNEDTDICEELPQSWDANQTMVKGFSYAIKFSVKIDYNPSYVLGPYGYIIWRIPITYHEGSKVTLGFDVLYPMNISFDLSDADDKTEGLNASIHHMRLYVYKDRLNNVVNTVNCQIRFIAGSNSTLYVNFSSLDVLNDVIITSSNHFLVSDLKNTNYIIVHDNDEELQIDRIEFSSKNVYP